jgi:hypothetical protein
MHGKFRKWREIKKTCVDNLMRQLKEMSLLKDKFDILEMSDAEMLKCLFVRD